MSKADAKKFLDSVDQSSNLQSRLEEHRSKIADIAAEHGYEFTAEELHDELRNRWQVSKPKDDPDTCTMA